MTRNELYCLSVQMYDDAAKGMQAGPGNFIGEGTSRAFGVLLREAKQICSNNKIIGEIQEQKGGSARFQEFLPVIGQLKAALGQETTKEG
jgi:hypothetical protein